MAAAIREVLVCSTEPTNVGHCKIYSRKIFSYVFCVFTTKIKRITVSPIHELSTHLLPIISKVLEQHIYEKLSNFLSISDQQWGFLTGRSTTGALCCEWQALPPRQRNWSANWFSKAFDSVPHAKLISKLTALNAPPHGFPVICIAESSKLSLVHTQLLLTLHLVYHRALC